MLVIDRFEGDNVIIEYSKGDIKKTFDIPRFTLPDNAKEGDVIKMIIDQDTTASRKERIQDLSNKLFE